MENKNSGRAGKLCAKSASLMDLIEYQEGAVVSRALIDRKAGTVTLFAFDEGQGLSEHTAPYDALVYLLEGETDIGIFGKRLRLRKGDVTMLPANRPHTLTAVTKFKMVLTMIRS